MRAWRWLMLALLAACLVACGVRPRAVVSQEASSPPARGTTSTQKPVRGPSTHLVVRGDTLYGIAFRHGLDYRELARWNRIAAPYTIYPGQKLRLTSPTGQTGGVTVASTGSASGPSATPASGTVAATPAPVTGAAKPAPPAPASSTVPASPATPAPAAPAPSSTSSVAATNTVGNIAWRWPASGQVIARFVAGEQTRQGINIAGTAGQAVVAAADGEVVYSGSGLIGYGELIIIRHSDTFLSAYGHNRRRLVDEGQRVKAGQQIAEMGRSGASRDMLHFEIRRSGKPIDPLPLLPRQ